ncbi:hypothetical protein RJ640_028492 [Escallonia rubra]|uniref:Uncharacterized protein n=1 Tax=Escallonia rubra TaxID=112253 RepID=A0AA88RQ08_9ASTE|nr:hypothetical protein RJ640_028492 [Escallonia rubra]
MLDVSNKGLKRVVSPSLGRLDQLKVLDLSYNNLEGGLPANLSNLKQLEVLDVNHNALSGPVFQVLAGLKSIYSLNISSNSFNGDVNSLGELPNLAMSTKDLLALIWEYPLPEGWYARVPGLQEPANYGTEFEMRIYEDQDFKYPGKPTPNNLTKHILSHIKLRGGLSIYKPLSEEQLEWAKIIPRKPFSTGLSIPPPLPAIPTMSSAETIPLDVLHISH